MTEKASGNPDRRVSVLLCPPLFFARRRTWVSFTINGLLYVFCLFFVVIGLHGVLRGVKDAGSVPLVGIPFWLVSLAHVADTRRRELARAQARPPVPLKSRLVESVLILAVPGVMAFGLARQAAGPWTIDVSRIPEALWEADWIVEQAQQYQRIEARNPGTVAELRRRLPEAEIEVTDPWGRDWVVSPTFQDTARPPNSGDLWVCSRGPTGKGRCPPENLGDAPTSMADSIGYSARFGGWQVFGRSWRGQGDTILFLLLTVGPLPGYIAYRMVRRVRRCPAPPFRSVSGAIGTVVVAGILALIALPMFPSIGTRTQARYAKVQSDFRIISACIVQFRNRTGTSPATLADLTGTTTDSGGQVAEPCLEKLPTPPCCGRSQYSYKRWSDGRYLLKHSDAHGTYPTLLWSGS